MTAPRCLVCDKEIAKDIRMISFYPATANGRQNGEREHNSFYLDEDQRPTTREELTKYTNGEIRKVYDHGRSISAFNVWDGETYVDLYFHSERCAAIFGRRMAQRGHR